MSCRFTEREECRDCPRGPCARSCEGILKVAGRPRGFSERHAKGELGSGRTLASCVISKAEESMSDPELRYV
jgi:hypothetical protein